MGNRIHMAVLIRYSIGRIKFRIKFLQRVINRIEGFCIQKRLCIRIPPCKKDIRQFISLKGNTDLCLISFRVYPFYIDLISQLIRHLIKSSQIFLPESLWIKLSQDF